eukprot:4109297-Amphidinium_carterae.3
MPTETREAQKLEQYYAATCSFLSSITFFRAPSGDTLAAIAVALYAVPRRGETCLRVQRQWCGVYNESSED